MNEEFDFILLNLMVLITSYVINRFLISYGDRLIKYRQAYEISQPQNIHSQETQRIGGIGIFIASSYTAFLAGLDINNSLLCIYIFSFPIFLIGLIEDIFSNLTALKRIIFIAFFSGISIAINSIYISQIGLGLDTLLSNKILSLFFTIFAITGLINAYNIIDGLNGLSSFMSSICLLSITIISSLNDNSQLAEYSLICLSSIIGFQLLNYPNAKIFLGDCGAYYLGYLCAILSILLIINNRTISPVFALAINIYPVTETIYSIYRRIVIQKTAYGAPDRLHLHSLIFDLLNQKERNPNNSSYSNAKATIYILVPTLFFVFISLFFYKSNVALIILISLYIFLYVLIYKNLYKIKKSSQLI